MRIRTLGPADLDPVRRLCAVSLPRDQYPDQVPLILTRLDHAAFVAEVGREVVGCCIGSKSRHGAPGDCHLDLIIVDSRHRRKGIGRALFEHLESGFLAVGCTTLKIEGNAPSYAWAGVDVHYTSGLCFVERMGFARGRCAVNMSVDLSSVALDTEESRAGLAADGISVRPAEESDEGALEALAGRWSPRWPQQLVLALHESDSGVFIAEAGGSGVGFCCHGVNRIEEVGPLWVDPDRRRVGIAAVLLRLCCGAQRDLGLQRAELQWAGPLAYLSDVLGASVSRAFLLFEKKLTDHGGVAGAS